MKFKNIKLKNHLGTFSVVGVKFINGKMLYLLQSDTFGDLASCIIVSKNLVIIKENVTDGFKSILEEGK